MIDTSKHQQLCHKNSTDAVLVCSVHKVFCLLSVLIPSVPSVFTMRQQVIHVQVNETVVTVTGSQGYHTFTETNEEITSNDPKAVTDTKREARTSENRNKSAHWRIRGSFGVTSTAHMYFLFLLLLPFPLLRSPHTTRFWSPCNSPHYKIHLQRCLGRTHPTSLSEVNEDILRGWCFIFDHLDSVYPERYCCCWWRYSPLCLPCAFLRLRSHYRACVSGDVGRCVSSGHHPRSFTR